MDKTARTSTTGGEHAITSGEEQRGESRAGQVGRRREKDVHYLPLTRMRAFGPKAMAP